MTLSASPAARSHVRERWHALADRLRTIRPEGLRLAMAEERIGANPNAARYDLEHSRIRVAEKPAGNSRAVVSLGATDLMSSLPTAREAVVANDAADAAEAAGSAAAGAEPA